MKAHVAEPDLRGFRVKEVDISDMRLDPGA